MTRLEKLYEIDGDEKRINVIAEFSYDPNESANIITSIRKYFRNTLPKQLRVGLKYDRQIIYPLSYGYLRAPVTISFPKSKSLRLWNRAVGISINYSYLGLLKDFKKTIVLLKKKINEMRKKPYKYAKAIESVKINVGFEV